MILDIDENFQQADEDTPETDLKGIRVVAVDDNATNRYIIRELLHRWGMTAEVVSSAPEVMAQLKASLENGTPYQLLISDYQMPEMDGLQLVKRIRSHKEFENLKIIILSSVTETRGAARYRKLSIDAYLSKPIYSSELKSVICSLIGGRPENPDHRPEAEPSVSRAVPKPCKILLAEDNVINQKLTTRYLQKLGHDVVIANDGEEAFRFFQEDNFDLLLMDVQMPKMDGFEAAQKIREAEQARGHRTPIVALTANAMAGDRERCLRAGMDDYLAKPMRLKDLEQTIHKWLSVSVK